MAESGFYPGTTKQLHNLTLVLTCYPGVIFYLSTFYTRSELAGRLSIYYAASEIAGKTLHGTDT